jgi:4-hydroxythreonine-4-phosphate dehydrogenase
MEERKVRVAITQGDTNGIGYEVILKTFEDPTMLELCTPIIYGSTKVAAYYRKALNMQLQFNNIENAEDAKEGRLNLLTVTEEELKIDLGQQTTDSEEAARKALERAKADVENGLADALVTAPAACNNLLAKDPQALSMLANDELRIALVTKNVAIKDVAEAITKQKIVEKGAALHHCLKRDLRITNPRIAVLALNPHAGANGLLGDEEQELISPAIDELAQQGIQAFGPYAADTFFGNGDFAHFDAVLAMYYDQGMAPFKAIVPDCGVRYIAGLPIVIAAPDHGSCFEIAGQGNADAAAMRNALYMAIDVTRNRLNYDEPLENPLPKLYHEKRDDSEKVRFAVPKAKGPEK